jgi:hypothetical protein
VNEKFNKLTLGDGEGYAEIYLHELMLSDGRKETFSEALGVDILIPLGRAIPGRITSCVIVCGRSKSLPSATIGFLSSATIPVSSRSGRVSRDEGHSG